MREALPNATFVGFTGTPLERDDRNTPAVFGEYADIYDIRQAIEDNATVPPKKKRTHNRESNRPAKLSPKSKEKLSNVEATYLEARLDGATMKEAVQAAGLAPIA